MNNANRSYPLTADDLRGLPRALVAQLSKSAQRLHAKTNVPAVQRRLRALPTRVYTLT